jgi:hypothetical protein
LICHPRSHIFFGSNEREWLSGDRFVNRHNALDIMFRIPVRSRRLRWLALTFGAIVIWWLSREDNDVAGVTILGCGLSLLLLMLTVTGRFGGRHISTRFVLAGGVMFGLLAGLGTAVVTPLLMLFKNALHAHLFLDYPPPIMFGILQHAPAWMFVGALTGLGLVLAWLARQDEQAI